MANASSGTSSPRILCLIRGQRSCLEPRTRLSLSWRLAATYLAKLDINQAGAHSRAHFQVELAPLSCVKPSSSIGSGIVVPTNIVHLEGWMDGWMDDGELFHYMDGGLLVSIMLPRGDKVRLTTVNNATYPGPAYCTVVVWCVYTYAHSPIKPD
ncbi:hypothetical protein SAY86_030827 [Trapa natans]|uniref:Uncharacterized protein n=1 Tax=Trapa natans TaxID=22666 RepID=A0AAN7MNV4_TRANT|nr:hypothetical protein SAY86_030827 [Trapa natans]